MKLPRGRISQSAKVFFAACEKNGQAQGYPKTTAIRKGNPWELDGVGNPHRRLRSIKEPPDGARWGRAPSGGIRSLHSPGHARWFVYNPSKARNAHCLAARATIRSILVKAAGRMGGQVTLPARQAIQDSVDTVLPGGDVLVTEVGVGTPHRDGTAAKVRKETLRIVTVGK